MSVWVEGTVEVRGDMEIVGEVVIGNVCVRVPRTVTDGLESNVAVREAFPPPNEDVIELEVVTFNVRVGVTGTSHRGPLQRSLQTHTQFG